MMSRALTPLAVIACVLLGFVVASQAQTMPIGPGDGFASVTYPKSWNTSRIDRGVQGATQDEAVYVWAEAYTLKTIDTIVKEHDAYFTKQGVATGEPTSQTTTVNGIPATFMNFPATWNGKPTLLRYVLLDPDPASKWKLSMCVWSSPEGEKLYASDMKSIMMSVTFKSQ
jgi:hypothetical protein